MVPVNVYSLIITEHPATSLLLLCPDEDTVGKTQIRVIPILIGATEADQIGAALKGVRMERPSTHDLFMDALTNLDTLVSRVEIDKVEGKSFFSTLFLREEGREIALDARPSDSVSLALRQNAPILIGERVMEETAHLLSVKEKGEGADLAEFHSFIEGISPDDFIENEDKGE